MNYSCDRYRIAMSRLSGRTGLQKISRTLMRQDFKIAMRLELIKLSIHVFREIHKTMNTGLYDFSDMSAVHIDRNLANSKMQ